MRYGSPRCLRGIFHFMRARRKGQTGGRIPIPRSVTFKAVYKAVQTRRANRKAPEPCRRDAFGTSCMQSYARLRVQKETFIMIGFIMVIERDSSRWDSRWKILIEVIVDDLVLISNNWFWFICTSIYINLIIIYKSIYMSISINLIIM